VPHRQRLQAEAEGERELRVALEEALNTAMRAAGLRGLPSSRDLGASREEREAALMARADQLRGLIEGAQADKQGAVSKAREVRGRARLACWCGGWACGLIRCMCVV
jgi:hypothetical protein